MPLEEVRRYGQLRDAAALEAYRVSPDLPKPIIQAAEVIARTDPARAERMFRQAASLVRSNTDLLGYVAGKAPQVPGMAAEAESWVRRAIELKPGSSAWPLGNVLLTLGRYSEAAEAYERGPDFIDVHALAAATHALAGEDAAARGGPGARAPVPRRTSPSTGFSTRRSGPRRSRPQSPAACAWPGRRSATRRSRPSSAGGALIRCPVDPGVR